jgi:NAD(P)-dependent dehydrogenase (short-subunit alcohol dehydrogenase family)
MSSCIVTGAAAGNGLAIARCLQEHGHRVVAIDRTPVPEEIGTIRIQGDVLDDAVMAAAFDQSLAEANADVCLINNAGITLPGTPQSDTDWVQTLNVNLGAPFRWTRAYATHVETKRIRQGAVVFIGSLATLRGFPGNPAYQAAKSGVLGLTRAFAVDLGRFGIRVNCLSPGYIRTAMTERSFSDPQLNEARRKHTLLDRWGRPEDVAAAVAFLCGPSAAYITGINLPVDGGWLARGLVE